MKKVFLVITAIFGSLTLMAQQPERPILHNQFRDFVDIREITNLIEGLLGFEVCIDFL